MPLKLGYVGIKNRSQADIQEKKTVIQSLEEEKMFFSKSLIYSSLPASCLGTQALTTSLTKVLESNILQFLPNLHAEVSKRKHSLLEMYCFDYQGFDLMESHCRRLLRKRKDCSGKFATDFCWNTERQCKATSLGSTVRRR